MSPILSPFSHQTLHLSHGFTLKSAILHQFHQVLLQIEFQLFFINFTKFHSKIGKSFSSWFVFVYLMADMIPRGHGGDGAGDPPHPDPFRRGTHETDPVPLRKVRGKAS
ncbi:hypothetical protein HanPI659440_Chr03g0110781 [Helianthus annuus]|nr:hypothetical protein HanPI659440_Chr03g0110781 [Helianthus annuus]